MPAASTRNVRALAGASVIVTRPSATAESLVRGVRALGGTAIRLPGMRLAAADDAAAVRASVLAARNADIWIFTSPSAVHFFLGLAVPFSPAASARVLAVGAGTARALAIHGIAALAPAQLQSSEGLLGESVLAAPQGQSIVIIDAPGGRDLLVPVLQERGARVERIGVYQRLPPRLTRRQLETFDHAERPWISLVSSGLALTQLLAALPSGLGQRWQAEALIVRSTRLAGQALAAGFADIHLARSALGHDLIDCACAVLGRHRL